MSAALLQSDLGSLPLFARGKVRDIYALGPEADADLLFVATDRISAFDHVLGTGIPDKGRILTQLSLFWFDLLRPLVANHLRSPGALPPSLEPSADQLAGRSMVVRRARMFPVECVVRGYLSGSGWKEYKASGGVCGIELPAGLKESDRLPAPIFTPAAKNQVGHDENISFAATVATIGEAAAERLRELTLAIYTRASEHAAGKGLILADTKFEFGTLTDEDGMEQIVLADEVLTPDSSRFWPAAGYAPGGPQPSFDKQFVRDYLESIHWSKQAPAPELPPEVVEKTRAKVHGSVHPADRAQRPGRLVPMNVHSLTYFDWALVALLAYSTVRAMMRGLVREIFALVGLMGGIVLASWNYMALADKLGRWIGPAVFAQVAAFLLITIVVNVACATAGKLLSQSADAVGLGFFDRVLGAVFGLARGFLFGTGVLLVLAAFDPGSSLTRNSQLAPYFLAGAHGVSFVVPQDLARQIADGTAQLKHTAPAWIKPLP